VGADLADGHQTQLREGALAVLIARRAQSRAVGGGIGRLEDAAVQGHDQPAAVPDTGQARRRQGPAGAVEEQFHGQRAQTLACLGEGGIDRQGVVTGGVDVAPDHGEGAVTEQGSGDDEPDDLVGGQAAVAQGGSAGEGEDFLDGVEREQAIQRGEQSHSGIDEIAEVATRAVEATGTGGEAVGPAREALGRADRSGWGSEDQGQGPRGSQRGVDTFDLPKGPWPRSSFPPSASVSPN
jgi:hypothetical protein